VRFGLDEGKAFPRPIPKVRYSRDTYGFFYKAVSPPGPGAAGWRGHCITPGLHLGKAGEKMKKAGEKIENTIEKK
jgi:hypothetical protein